MVLLVCVLLFNPIKIRPDDNLPYLPSYGFLGLPGAAHCG